MVHEKWAISDTHLLHTNILKFKKKDGSRLRNFNYLEEMHTLIIANWNAVVGVNDYVYHLGDVTFQYNGLFNEIMSQLNGKKRLIVGNHDKIWNPNLMRWFEKVELWRGWKDLNFTMSHMPLKEGHFRDGKYNLHGHTHDTVLGMPYINVCVETRNFTPVHFDTIIKEIKDAEYKQSNR